MIIFLDFDGVLHPAPPGENGVFYHLARLEEVLRRNPDLRLVVSSSWREVYSWPEIVSFFSDDLQPRLIGKTPILPGANRYAEILAWLEQAQYRGAWVALDDAEQEFPSGCKQLCLCDSMRGFDEAAAQRLGRLISQFRKLPTLQTQTDTSDFIRTFIDTEFSDLVDMSLISIALVAADGCEFYAELDDFNTEQCNSFVRKNVLPQLGNVPGARMSRAELRNRLLDWLLSVRRNRKLIIVSYDYFGDWALLLEVLGDIPDWVRPDNIRGRVDETNRKKFFEIAVEKQHHALWDARALRASYRSEK